MSLSNIKQRVNSQKGFTIVELLIVIVVIGILAAITIVAYNGVTAKANGSAAKSSAATVAKKAELYLADGGNNRYPVLTTDFNSDATKSYYLAGTTADVSITYAASTSSLSSSNGTNSVVIRKCAAGTPANQAAIPGTNAVTGLEIYYWDYTATTPAVTTTPVKVGTNTGSTTTCPAS